MATVLFITLVVVAPPDVRKYREDEYSLEYLSSSSGHVGALDRECFGNPKHCRGIVVQIPEPKSKGGSAAAPM
jgi:hypothetical protein